MRLKEDTVRARTVLVAPERIVTLDTVAADVLRLCTGTATVGEIAQALAESYAAAPDEIEADVAALLADLARSGLVVT